MLCKLCPRRCGADRSVSRGFCGAPKAAVCAKAYIHKFEEPCLAGDGEHGGSGAVFFSGCQLRCPFCQNYEISHVIFGKSIDENALCDVFLRLQDEGAYNIDLISATPYIDTIIAALDICKDKLKIPVIFNSGGYELPETIERLRGYVDIFLPDFKFFSPELSQKYLGVRDYPEYAMASLEKMIDVAGTPKINDNGIMKSGVILRHLVMPGCRKDSEALLCALYEKFGADKFLLSIMSQYTPCFDSKKYPEIDRKVTSFEYNFVVDTAAKLGFDGFTQQRESAGEQYIPIWDMQGL